MDDDKFPGIDTEIEILQEQKNISDEHKIRDLIILLMPLIVSVVGSFALNSFIIFIIGMCVTCGEVAVGQIINIIDDLKDKKKTPLTLVSDKKLSADDFYTEAYKNYYARTHTEQNIKYEEAVKKQNAATNNIKIYKEKKELSKEDSMYKIVRALDVYSKVYTLPPIVVSDEEWDKLFDEMYKLYDESYGVSFYVFMLDLVKFTLASTLLENKEVINVNTFIDNIQNIIDVDDEYTDEIRKTITTHDVQKIIKFPIAK